KNTAGGGNVLKRAVATVVVKPTGIPTIRFRRAIGFVFAIQAAEDVRLRGPVHVIADEQIEKSIPIVIKPDRRAAQPLFAEQAAGFGYVKKCALAGVAE